MKQQLNPSTARKRQLAADGTLVLVALFWGLTFVVVKDAIAVIDVWAFLGQRFALAGAVMLPFMVARRRRFSPRLLQRGAFLGLLLFGAFAFQTFGLLHTSASNAAFVTGMNVVLVPLAGALLFGSPIPWRIRGGVVLAGLGLFLLTTEGTMAVNRGDALMLGCAVCVALQILYTGRYAGEEDVTLLTGIELVAVGVLSTLCGWMEGTEVFFYEPRVVTALIVCALFATVFAFVAQTAMQRFTTPARTALVFCMEPVFAAGFAALLIGERLGFPGYAGAGLILTGMIIAELPDSPLPQAS
jgi:drug/metabolite transporter (DMT)-like permease